MVPVNPENGVVGRSHELKCPEGPKTESWRRWWLAGRSGHAVTPRRQPARMTQLSLPEGSFSRLSEGGLISARLASGPQATPRKSNGAGGNELLFPQIFAVAACLSDS